MKRTFSNCNPYHDTRGRFTNQNNARTIVPCCGSGPETPSSQSRQQTPRQPASSGNSNPRYVVLHVKDVKRNTEFYTLSAGRPKNQNQDREPKPAFQSEGPTQRPVVVPVQQVPRNIQASVIPGSLRTPRKPDLEQQKEVTPQPAPNPRARALKEVITAEAAKKKYTFGDWAKDEFKDSLKWATGCNYEKLEENNKRLEELRNEPGGWEANWLEVLKLKASSSNELYGALKRLDQFKEYIAPSTPPKGSFLGRTVFAPKQPAKSLMDAYPVLKGRAGRLAKFAIAGAGMLWGEKFSKEGETPKKYNVANLAYDLAKYLTCDWDVFINNKKRLEELWHEPGGLSANKAEVGRIITTTGREFFNLFPLGKIIKTSTKGAKLTKKLINAYKEYTKNKQLTDRTAANPSSSAGTPRVKPTQSSSAKDISTGEATTKKITKKIKSDLFKEKRVETTQGSNRVHSQKTTSSSPKTSPKGLSNRKAEVKQERRDRFCRNNQTGKPGT